MNVFIMHIGNPGHVDVKYTVTKRRHFAEILDKLPANAPERQYFESDEELHEAFPDGSFNCWGFHDALSQRLTRLALVI
jgi:hypothetical protein